mgnify:CR=1 FL=1
MANVDLAVGGSGQSSANNAVATGTAGGPLAANVTYAKPAALVIHQITSDQLTALESSRTPGLSEAKWAMVAGALVAAVPSLHALSEAYGGKESHGLTVWGFGEVFLFVVCAVIAITLQIVGRRQKHTLMEIIRTVRGS